MPRGRELHRENRLSVSALHFHLKGPRSVNRSLRAKGSVREGQKDRPTDGEQRVEITHRKSAKLRAHGREAGAFQRGASHFVL